MAEELWEILVGFVSFVVATIFTVFLCTCVVVKTLAWMGVTL